ncbi:hypothetical protein CB1_001728002 [Camelus ferus]|nr:hypothetical protein CB1_001728002 [Camelus ferus]
MCKHCAVGQWLSYLPYLEEEYRKGAREDDPMPPVQPYHYGSHYSNSGTVLHFLVRMPPFTKMFLAYQGFDFGVRQNGERVNHVNLPPWARNDPRLFILIHRQALESDYVSQNICQWIDLVFGYKQKGKASVQAINVFHPATYFGMDVSAVEDPVQRRALETMIKTYGQTPRQLFQSAHASRPGSRLSIEGELPAAVGLLVQFAFRETKEQVKEVTYPVCRLDFSRVQQKLVQLPLHTMPCALCSSAPAASRCRERPSAGVPDPCQQERCVPAGCVRLTLGSVVK